MKYMRDPISKMRFIEDCKNSSTDECILWPWAVEGSGYGQMRIGGKHYRVHRIVWSKCFGEIPEGMGVLHKCDMPRCVNPLHLFLGTHSDNMIDMALKKRSKGVSRNAGMSHGISKLNEEAVRLIRAGQIDVMEACKRYSICRDTFYRARNGESYRNV